MPTPEVFSRFDHLGEVAAQLPPERPTIPRALMLALASGETDKVGRLLVNDLTPAALSILPSLHATLRAGREVGAACLGSVLSGSGPTVAFLMSNEESANQFGAYLVEQGLAQDVRTVHSPVPGASLL